MNEENFFELVCNIFYKFGQIKPETLSFTFSKQLHYPTISSKPVPSIVVPLPIKEKDAFIFEGMVFDNTEYGRTSMWCLFLATIYHLAAHACMSRYENYERWRKNKTPEICNKVIDFIEDIVVENYISHRDLEIWKNIEDINSKLMNFEKDSSTNNKMRQQLKQRSFHAARNDEIIKAIKTKIINERDSNSEKMLFFADMLYKNRELLEYEVMPYCEHHGYQNLIKPSQKGVEFVPLGDDFTKTIMLLDELWMQDQQTKQKILRRFQKHLKNLNFDTVVLPSGDLQSFLQTKSKILPMIKRIRQQLRMITNMNDDTKIDRIGYVDLQMAIQIMASEGQSQDIFERDELRRGEEAWVILVDTSSSMKLRFEHIKEFTICVAESANELTGNPNAWAIYSFNNNFQILKDFKEKYTKEVQARIGNLENRGLSLLPDAIDLASRILAEDTRERKYLFVITDGHPTGYERIHQTFSKVIKRIEGSDITLVAIGVSKDVKKNFKNSVRGHNLRQLVAKFITAYRAVSE